VYDSLRPAAKVQLVLSGGEPLTDQDVEVRYSEGLAKLALAPRQKIWSQLASLFSVGIILVYGGVSARAFAKDHFSFKARLEPAALLRRGKPFLLSNGDWTENLKDAASRLSDQRTGETGDVSSWEVYRILNSRKPEHITEDNWHKIVPDLIASLVSRMRAGAVSEYGYARSSDIRKLLFVSKPAGVFDENWDRLMKSLSKLYVAALIAENRIWDLSLSQIVKRLAEPKPEGLGDADWEGYRTLQTYCYFAVLFAEIRGSAKPTEVLNGADLSSLSEYEVGTLRTYAYSKELAKLPDIMTPRGADQFLNAERPPFMPEEQYERLAETAQMVRKAARFSVLLPQLERLVAGSQLAADKPSDASQDEWANLKRIEHEIVTLREKNERRDAALFRQEAEASTLKTRVLKQLEVINDFINDPCVLDRIEDYEEAFAPGNLANLKSLAAFRRTPRVG
jgi:hypothetical protein